MAAAGTSSPTPFFARLCLLQAEDFGCRGSNNGPWQNLSHACIYSSDCRRPWPMGHVKAKVATPRIFHAHYRLWEQPLPRQ